MPRELHREDIAPLGRGYALLGSGGGGSPHILELALGNASIWPLPVHGVDEVPSETPCMAIAYAGSTLLLGERLPDEAPFAVAISAAERWLGHPIPAVCSLEAGGMNGLACLPLAKDRIFVDADLMGRALPDFNQISVLADAIPGIVAACPTGGGGVMVIDSARPEDFEHVIRTALTRAGGWAGVVIAGFTVGDLVEHSIVGVHAAARNLGETYLRCRSKPLPELAAALGAALVAVGRVSALQAHEDDPRIVSIDVRSPSGDVVRLIARSELLACMRNGVVEAAAPTVIVAVDARTRDILQVHQLTPGQDIAVLALPAPAWWISNPTRLARVSPDYFGLHGLDTGLMALANEGCGV